MRILFLFCGGPEETSIKSIPPFVGGIEEKQKIRVKMGGVTTDIRTEHFPNSNLERYFYTASFSDTAYI
jgi:hypothetical protein